jgi:hypothetical protein
LVEAETAVWIFVVPNVIITYMAHSPILKTLTLVSLLAVSNLGSDNPEDGSKACTITCKVIRSDSNSVISNSYILLTQEQNSLNEARHFDGRTDKNGEYIFKAIPPGKYTVSVYAWFPAKSDVPCQNPLRRRTADGGSITVEWQPKSQAFMEIVTIRGFSADAGAPRGKDFDLYCR